MHKHHRLCGYTYTGAQTVDKVEMFLELKEVKRILSKVTTKEGYSFLFQKHITTLSSGEKFFLYRPLNFSISQEFNIRVLVRNEIISVREHQKELISGPP